MAWLNSMMLANQVRISIGLLGLGVAACSTPDEADARAWHERHEATLQKIDTKTREAVKAIPELTQPFACSPSKRPAAAPASASASASPPRPKLAMPIKKLVEANRCAKEKDAWIAERGRKIQAFRGDVLVPLMRLPGVLGIDIRYRRPEDAQWHTLGSLGLTPGGVMKGHVPWMSGIDVGGHKVGWGEYQTSYENERGRFGDDRGRPGIEAAWEVDEGKAHVRIVAFVLAEDTLDEGWRAGLGK